MSTFLGGWPIAAIPLADDPPAAAAETNNPGWMSQWLQPARIVRTARVAAIAWVPLVETPAAVNPQGWLAPWQQPEAIPARARDGGVNIPARVPDVEYQDGWRSAFTAARPLPIAAPTIRSEISWVPRDENKLLQQYLGWWQPFQAAQRIRQQALGAISWVPRNEAIPPPIGWAMPFQESKPLARRQGDGWTVWARIADTEYQDGWRSYFWPARPLPARSPQLMGEVVHPPQVSQFAQNPQVWDWYMPWEAAKPLPRRPGAGNYVGIARVPDTEYQDGWRSHFHSAKPLPQAHPRTSSVTARVPDVEYQDGWRSLFQEAKRVPQPHARAFQSYPRTPDTEYQDGWRNQFWPAHRIRLQAHGTVSWTPRDEAIPPAFGWYANFQASKPLPRQMGQGAVVGPHPGFLYPEPPVIGWRFQWEESKPLPRRPGGYSFTWREQTPPTFTPSTLEWYFNWQSARPLQRGTPQLKIGIIQPLFGLFRDAPNFGWRMPWQQARPRPRMAGGGLIRRDTIPPPPAAVTPSQWFLDPFWLPAKPRPRRGRVDQSWSIYPYTNAVMTICGTANSYRYGASSVTAVLGEQTSSKQIRRKGTSATRVLRSSATITVRPGAATSVTVKRTECDD